MTSIPRLRFAIVTLATAASLWLAAARVFAAAQAAPSGATEGQGAAAATTPQLNRIREALGQERALDLNDEQLRFYLEIIAKQPKFTDFIKGYDFLNGPTRRGSPMTNREFLNLVTPQELYSTAGITPSEQLQFALTNWLGKALVERALEDLKNARTEREMQAIRDRIDHELAILRGDASNSR